jgi:hypothetical protein
MKTKIVTIIALITWIRFGCAQGFVNLDFNSANIPDGTPQGSFVPIADAIPGWTAYYGNSQQTSVLYDAGAIGSVNIAIIDANNPAIGLIPGDNYTVFLQSGNNGGDGGAPNATASIAQTAMIPSTAESIVFTASFPYEAGWQITIDGLPISVSQIGTVGGSYGIFAGNVSPYAGRADQLLEFTALYGGYSSGVNVSLGNIAFSTSPVPEPSSFGLFALGGMFVVCLHWRKPSPKVSPDSSPCEH